MIDDHIDTLLADCLDQPPTEWCARIDALCSEHDDLAGELRRRFDALVRLGIVEPPAAAPDAPDRLGHFRLARRVGGGGMGVVYEAWDEKLNRKVALKIIRGDQQYFAGSRERFAREMQAASRLDHPNLCPVYDAGELDGVPYLAMRFIEGESLAAALDRRRRARASGRSSSRGVESRPGDILAMVEKLARGLHAAHENGLVHRDVKPANVLIDPAGEPVLVDFGLARETESSLSGLTRTGERIGTPVYMAPEQVSGRGAIDRRTDVYALGTVLYECLTLRCPFVAPAREDLYRQILTTPPSFDSGMGVELRVVIGKALEKDPRNRFATAEELAEELRRIREHEPIRSRRPGVPLRLLRWCQRNRAAAGILAATTIGLVVSLWALRDSYASSQRSRALALLQLAGDVQERDPELAFRFVREALRMSDEPRIVAGIQETMFRLRECTTLVTDGASCARFSPDGRHIVVTAHQRAARVFRKDGDRWRELELPDNVWRGYVQLEPPPSAFSPDNGELSLRDLHSGTVYRYDLGGARPRKLKTLERRFDGWVSRVRYHPDPEDRRLMTVGRSATSVWNRDGVHLLDLENAKRPDGYGVLWHDALFLPGGGFVAGGRIWTAQGGVVAELPGFQSVQRVLRVGDRLVVCYYRNRIRQFTLDGEQVPDRDVSWPSDDLADEVMFSPPNADGTRLVAASGSGVIRVLDTDTLAVVSQWSADAELGHVRFSPDGRFIAGLDGHGRTRIWDLRGRTADVIHGHASGGYVEWSPVGAGILTAGGGKARLWSLDARPGVPALFGLGKPDLAVSPSGQDVVVISDIRRRLFLCDAAGGRRRDVAADLGVAHIRFAGPGRVAIGSERSSPLFTWDLSGAPRPASDELHPAMFIPPVLSQDGVWTVFGSGGAPYHWRPGGDKQYLQTQTIGPELHATCTPDGRIASVGWNGIRMWSEDAPYPARKLDVPGIPRHVEVSPDACLLLVATDTSAHLWDLTASPRERTVLIGHTAPLQCAVFSPDLTQIATSAEDGSIHVWERATRKPVLRLRHPGVRRIAFTASGRLVSAGEDGVVRWWSLDRAALEATVAAVGVRELDEVERALIRDFLGR